MALRTQEIKEFTRYTINDSSNNKRSVYDTKQGKFLEGSICKGHWKFTLRGDDGKQHTKYLHKLLAETFIPNSECLTDIHHINFKPLDNRLDNLQWMSKKDHIQLHSSNRSEETKKKLSETKSGDKNPNYGKHFSDETKKKLSDAQPKKQVYQYSTDYKIIRIWESINECGRNGFDSSHIIKCCYGKRKTHNGFIWSFKKIEKC